MSETPKTDAKQKAWQNLIRIEEVWDFARKLERELKEMHATALDYAANSDKAHEKLSRLELLSEQWEHRHKTADDMATNPLYDGETKARLSVKASTIRSMTVELKRELNA